MKLVVQPFKQEGLQMYVGIARVGDILDVSDVDTWKEEDGKESGYQRAPETARTGKVARYLQSAPTPLMPSSVLLSYRGHLNSEPESDGVSVIDVPDRKALWIVDGQHRLYGFKKAIEELGIERLKDYVLPVVIVEFTSLEDEANQFRIINETMKKVRTDLARRILALRMAGLGHAGRREVRVTGRLWEATAVEVLKSLNSDEDSPWFGRIQPPNVRKQERHVIRELSFSTSLKPVLNEHPYRTWSAERVASTLKAYWKAWESLVPEAFQNAPGYVLLKTPGAFSLHQVALYVLDVLRARDINEPLTADFKGVLSDLGDYATMTYWAADNPEGAAMAGSMKGFAILADAMQEELESAGHIT